MSSWPIVTIPVGDDGPAMRRRRKEPPPPRRPRIDEYRLAKFADRLFNERSRDEREQDRELRDLAERDWRTYIDARFRLSEAERETLASLPDEVVDHIADAVHTAMSRGGALSVRLPRGKEGGEIVIFGPAPGERASKRTKKASVTARTAGSSTSPGSAGFKIPILKCTFDANCRNWRCRPG